MQNSPEKIRKLAETIEANGGRALLVGGCVRDALMDITPKDYDVEVYGIAPQKLRQILDSFGKIDAVGEAFTVYKIGQDLDVSLPRRERKTGRGHRGFVVEGDPLMSFEEACKRRDFTINAILQDPLTDEIIDPFNGQTDIEKQLIRVVSTETFAEDSLRVLRAAQFAARFEFEIEAETVEICQGIDLTDLPKERIWGEFEKLLLKSNKPSIGLRWLYELNVVGQLFPELAALRGVPQQSEWHPEGWVFSALPPESLVASMTQAIAMNNGFTLREFLSTSTASTTNIPASGCTSHTQPSDSTLSNFESADSTRTNGFFSTAITSPAILTESESLVWSFGTLTPLADKVIRIMFKISLDKMRSIVFSTIDDFEIIRGIVQPVAVYVMNMLTSFQFTPQDGFHYNSVNTDSSVFSLTTDISIPIVVVDARTSAVDNNVFFYFDLSFVGDSDFCHTAQNTFLSNCFEVELGDVSYHTLLATDVARTLIDDLPYAKKITVMLGTLCHDFGKPATTQLIDGKWRSLGHDEAGVAPTESFLDKLGIFTLDGYDVRKQIVELVRTHLRPGEFYNARENLGDGAFRRLARKVEPDLLYRVAKADSLSRNGDWLPREKWFTAEAMEWFMEKSRELNVERSPPSPILLGRHLIELGLKPAPIFKQILDAVYEMQLDGRISDLEEAIEAAKTML